MTENCTPPRPIDILRSLIGRHPCEVLIDQDPLAWARSADMMVGFVRVGIEDWQVGCRAAYEALDDHMPVGRDERWSVLLYVRLPRGADEALARLVEANLMGSRKLAMLDGEVPLALHGLHVTAIGAAGTIAPVRPIEGALDEIVRGELRTAMETLLLLRRPAEKVRLLIDLLGIAEEEYGVS